jgi:hypothetical protein
MTFWWPLGGFFCPCETAKRLSCTCALADRRSVRGGGGACLGASTAEDPSELVVLFEWESLEMARQRVESQAVRQKFGEAGVAGGVEQTDFYFLEEAGRVRA